MNNDVSQGLILKNEWLKEYNERRKRGFGSISGVCYKGNRLFSSQELTILGLILQLWVSMRLLF